MAKRNGCGIPLYREWACNLIPNVEQLDIIPDLCHSAAELMSQNESPRNLVMAAIHV